MDILRIGALGIVAAVLSLVIKQYRPEMALQIALALGVVVFLFLSAQLSGITTVVSSLFSKADIKPDYFMTILKATGIAFITEFSSATCKDAGENSIAQKIEIGGKVLIVFLALPLLMSLLQQLLGVLQQASSSARSRLCDRLGEGVRDAAEPAQRRRPAKADQLGN